ncbi:MAG TPA: AraC family transcriptional regulator [Gemmatimonadales bacterium]|nr:AraC family transcriptional regulator [Gemmatimonadales bacterium]
MDPLSDVLRAVRLDGAYFYAVEATEPWSVRAVPAKQLTPRLLPHAEHLISYHILTEGRCWGGVRGEEQVAMLPGDVIVFPHGDAHLMSSASGLDLEVDDYGTTPERYPHTVFIGSAGRATATFVCGFLGCDLRPFNPLLATLPRRMHVRGLSQGWLSLFAGQVVEESRAARAGADCVLTRLAELMFIEVLRRHLETLSPEQTGWLAGLRDPMVGKALGLLHARPAHAWTLDELAREVASSRSKFAERFTWLVGEPPMQYLAKWRMQLAANRLAQGSEKVAAVAAVVGYESEAAFSRAFKKATGVSPAAWRQARRGAAQVTTSTSR